MDIYFLGTSSGTPTRQRNVSAIALVATRGNAWHLIDCGEATQHQILRSSLSTQSLQTIFITHLHGDHCYGLPGLLASAGLHGRKAPLTIVGPARLQDWLRMTIATTDLHLPYELIFEPVETLEQFQSGQCQVTSFELSHRIQCHGYAFVDITKTPQLDLDKLQAIGIAQGPLWGRIRAGLDIEFGGRIYSSEDLLKPAGKPAKIIICGDNDEPELIGPHIDGCDVLVHESTFATDMSAQAKKVRHSCAATIAGFAEQASIPNLLLTHFSARYGLTSDRKTSIDSLRAEAVQHYSGNLFLANDFDRYRLSAAGTLTLQAG